MLIAAGVGLDASQMTGGGRLQSALKRQRGNAHIDVVSKRSLTTMAAAAAANPLNPRRSSPAGLLQLHGRGHAALLLNATTSHHRPASFSAH